MSRKKSSQPTGRQANTRDNRAPVFSYYASRTRSGQQESRQTQKTSVHWRAGWLKYLPSIISLAAIAGGVIFTTTLSTWPRFDLAAKAGQPTILQDPSVYQKAAEVNLKRSIWNRSKLTINTDKLAAELEQQFPELRNVSVNVPLISRRPIIAAQPAEPAVILIGRGGAYLLGTDGRALVKAVEVPSSAKDNVPVISDETDVLIEQGKQMLPTDLVVFINRLDAQLRAKQVAVESYALPASANELHVRMQGEPYYVKFNTEVDVRLQVGTFLAVKEKLEADNVTPTEYIDVRVEERAYYK